MNRLAEFRSLAHGGCLSLGTLGVVGDVIINPAHYGELVHWGNRSTVIAAEVFKRRQRANSVAESRR